MADMPCSVQNVRHGQHHPLKGVKERVSDPLTGKEELIWEDEARAIERTDKIRTTLKNLPRDYVYWYSQPPPTA